MGLNTMAGAFPHSVRSLAKSLVRVGTALCSSDWKRRRIVRADRKPKENGSGFTSRTGVRCGIYTRKSTEEGLDQAFNTLDAQREAAESFINSQRQEGWVTLPQKY